MFKTQNFCHIASNNRNQVKAGVFVYRTTDDLATVSASGYFNARIIDINLHDLIIHEKIDAADATKVERNVLCVTERTLENVGVIVIKSKWEGDIEQEIADLKTYVDNNFVNIDGSSIMSGPLKFRAGSFEGAIAGGLGDGISVYKLKADGSIDSEVASLTKTKGFVPGTNNAMDIGRNNFKWKDAYVARVITGILNNGADIAVPVTNSADTLALKSQVDLAANSGSQLYDTGVWYAKMYAASTVPTGAEYDGTNYADFSQVDGDSNPIIVIYEGQSGAWVEIDRITPPTTYNGYITVTSKIWDIAEQTDQQGGQVLWSYNSKTFTPYPRIISVAGFADTDLSNLTDLGKNISNWSSNVTNCITNIPQDIKLKLNNGTLTLKAGSKVYVPNGAGVFNEITIASDITQTITYGSNDTMLLFVNSATNALSATNVNLCYSGSTQPTYADGAVWYDTNNNKIKQGASGSWVENYAKSLPIAIIKSASNVITSIDQVFNGFGYIGSTVFALPGVKGLIPDGRNADGSLKNIEVTVNNVLTHTGSYNNQPQWILLNSDSIQSWDSKYWIGYNRQENILFNKEGSSSATSGSQITACVCVFLSADGNQKITSFTPKTAFRAVDYSDTEYIAHQAMASNRYINLTLGANGSTYNAPADGYFVLRKQAGAQNQQIRMFCGRLANSIISYEANDYLEVSLPVSKGQGCTIYYSATGATEEFAFVFANGAK